MECFIFTLVPLLEASPMKSGQQSIAGIPKTIIREYLLQQLNILSSTYEYYLHSININEGFALCRYSRCQHRQTTKVIVWSMSLWRWSEAKDKGLIAQDNCSDYFFKICNGGSTIFFDCCTQAVDTNWVCAALRYYY